MILQGERATVQQGWRLMYYKDRKRTKIATMKRDKATQPLMAEDFGVYYFKSNQSLTRVLCTY